MITDENDSNIVRYLSPGSTCFFNGCVRKNMFQTILDKFKGLYQSGGEVMITITNTNTSSLKQRSKPYCDSWFNTYCSWT